METIQAQALVAAGAIIAALIAGLFSYFNLVLSKEQKLSEFRQSGIDGLRDDLSTFIAALHAVEYIDSVYRYDQGSNLKYVDLAEAVREPHMKAAIALNHILLRLNPNNKGANHQELIRILLEVKQAFTDSEYSKATDRVPELREKAQMVLKSEWKRVKRGEPTYRWSKRIAVLMIVGGLVLGVIFLIKSLR